MSEISERIQQIQQRISDATKRAGRNADDVRLLAVTKTFPAETIARAYEAGLRAFGENRVQELVTKTPVLPKDCQWHLIGHLQQNKVKQALTNAAWIHSVDSAQLLSRINRLSTEAGVTPQVLIEVNVSGEKSKFGAPPDQVEAIIASELNGPAIVRGLMTVAPAEATEAELHSIFADLRILRDRLENNLGIQLSELSMGMSHDFETAIAEGATIVRIGSAIFGHR